jgi:Ca2+-binding EF-hand superfamily protein
MTMTDISGLMGASAAKPSQSGRIDRLFSKLDQDNDGQLSQAEFNAIGQKLPPGQQAAATAKLADLFKAIDSSGDGFVSKDELTAFQQKQVAQMRDAMLSLQELLGTQGAGDASATRRRRHHHHNASQPSQSGTDPISQLMGKIDTDGSGSITKDELTAYLGKLVPGRAA